MHGKPNTPHLQAYVNSLPKDSPLRQEWSALHGYLQDLHRQQQGALAAKARLSIEYRTYQSLAEDPDYEPTPLAFEYWTNDHDRIHKLILDLRERIERAD